MTAFSDAPCEPWEIIVCCDLSGMSEAVTGAAHRAASGVLWARTGRRFGLCTATLRPCRDRTYLDQHGWWAYDMWPRPVLWNGAWFNLACDCGTGGDCSCEPAEQFTLPGPVANILEIVIDGVAVPTGSYRVDNYRKVVRTDGGTWPKYNNPNLDDGEVGTWSVTAQYGETPPELAPFAVGELTCEISKACAGGQCKLPSKVSQTVRTGVTQTFIDPTLFLEKGLLGLKLCDMLIETYNPGRLQSPSIVTNLDKPGFRNAGT